MKRDKWRRIKKELECANLDADYGNYFLMVRWIDLKKILINAEKENELKK